MKKKLIVSILLLTPLLLFSLILKRTSLSELAASSDLILRAEVLHSRSAWDENQEMIWTDSQLHIQEIYKGMASAREINVRQRGGQVGPVMLEVPGVGLLVPGEEVILFLKEHEGRFRIHSMELGKFVLLDNPENGVRMVSTIMPVEDIYDAPAAKRSRDEVTHKPIPYLEFINRLQTILE